MPSLVLIDGGLGQLHAAAQALEKLEIINQPVASIAKQEEILYVLGQEDQPIRLPGHSPVLHLIQQIRDETHRFAVGFHRQRRARRTLTSELDRIPGVGERTTQKLLRRFGSVAQVRRASVEELSRIVAQAPGAANRRAPAGWRDKRADSRKRNAPSAHFLASNNLYVTVSRGGKHGG